MVPDARRRAQKLDNWRRDYTARSSSRVISIFELITTELSLADVSDEIANFAVMINFPTGTVFEICGGNGGKYPDREIGDPTCSGSFPVGLRHGAIREIVSVSAFPIRIILLSMTFLIRIIVLGLDQSQHEQEYRLRLVGDRYPASGCPRGYRHLDRVRLVSGRRDRRSLPSSPGGGPSLRKRQWAMVAHDGRYPRAQAWPASLFVG